MRPTLFLAAAAVTGLAFAATGTAQAQGVSIGVGVDTGPPVTGDYYYGYRPSYSGEYGYRSRGYRSTRGYMAPAERVIDYPRRGGCGTYMYWDGDRCVDARDK